MFWGNMHLVHFLVFRGLKFSNFLILKEHRGLLEKLSYGLKKFGGHLLPLLHNKNPCSKHMHLLQGMWTRHSPKSTKLIFAETRPTLIIQNHLHSIVQNNPSHPMDFAALKTVHFPTENHIQLYISGNAALQYFNVLFWDQYVC